MANKKRGAMTDEEILDALKNAECSDSFCCIFGMHGYKRGKGWGCFAKFPNGDPDEENRGCVALQAAKLIERLKEDKQR